MACVSTHVIAGARVLCIAGARVLRFAGARAKAYEIHPFQILSYPYLHLQFSTSIPSS